MKGSAVAAAATLLAGGVSAHRAGHRHAHQLFQRKAYNESETCVPGCTTIYTTIKGTPELYIPTAPATTAVVPTTTPAVVVPTPIPQTCPTPGTYTFPATTITLTETTTVCGAATTEVPSGTYTLGGVTTVVDTETTVTCPYATTKTENGVVTSVLETTTYVCPSAGTYTIAPITTTVVEATTTIVYPVVTTYCPGTYTAPAVTTVVETATVIYCPFETPAPAPAPAPTEAAPAPPAAYQAAPPPPPPPAQEYPAAPAPPADVPKPKPKPVKPSPPAYSGGGELGGKGDKWAMTYTPFRDDGHCKTKEEVFNDIAAIARANFDTLRVYSTDCDTLPNVGAAAEAHGLKMIVGIFIGAPGCSNGNPDVATQIGALKAWKRWDLVSLCVVGNEALFNGYCSPRQLTDLIYHVKSELGSAGYKGPYTTTDVVSAYEQNDVSEICNAVDVVACNAHAYFDGNTKPSQAGPFVKSQLAIVEKICGKKGYIMETGWPTAGQCYGGCPGEQQQAEAINSIKNEMGKYAVFFSFDNDPWKKPGDCGCEQSWGCRKVFGI
ncbi:glycoside hydrolase [Naviculisporaceae sp. PSN 640]